VNFLTYTGDIGKHRAIEWPRAEQAMRTVGVDSMGTALSDRLAISRKHQGSIKEASRGYQGAIKEESR
jgi:hypothetical protein